MFSSAKPTASLSSGLLARKGQARPAMRPQGFLQMNPGTAHDDLGWNDMGEDFSPSHAAAPMPYVAPADETAEAPKPEVLRQIESLDEQLAAPQPEAFEEYDEEFEAEPEPVIEAPAAPVLAVRGKAKPTIVDAVEEPVEVAAEAPVAAIVAAPVATPVRKAPLAVAVSAKDKAAFTLRLDHDRHLRLRLASALTRRSSQQIVTQALDEFLASLEGVDALARQVDATDQG